MNQPVWRNFLKSLILTVFAVGFVAGEVWGQATFVSARHESISQRQIDVTFNQAINAGAPSIIGWTVTINGVGVPFTNQGNFGPNTARIQFDASAIAGHTAGQNFLKPGEVLRVRYNGTGAMTSAGGVNDTGLQISQNNFVFTCAEMIFFKQEAYASVDVCSPVVMNFTQYVYKLSLRFRNSSTFNLANIFYNIQWGDATVQNASPYVSDVSGVANPTFIDNTGFTGSNPAIILTSRPSHNYPAPNPTDCSFNFTLTPFVNGVASCPSISTTTLFATYDTDNANSGTLAMPPSVVGSNLVCLNDNVNMLFTDATTLNCRAAIEPIVPNEATRFIRIVYGSRNYDSPSIPGAVNNVPDIRVGGVPVTNNNANGTLIVPTGYFPTTACAQPICAVGVPDFNGVIRVATPVTAATATAYMQNITSVDAFSFRQVSQRFYVRLEYWDICNQYNPGDPTNPPPVTIENFVEIIDSPNPPTVNNPIVCESVGTGSYNITATGVGAGVLTYTWYLTPGGTVLQATSTDNTFNPVTEGPVGNRINPNVATSTIFNRYVTVTQGSNNCTSQPQTITIRIDALNTPGTIAHPLGASPITICNTDDPVAFTSIAAGTGGGPSGTFTYQWQNSTAFGGPYNNIGGANGATFDPTPAQIAAGRFFRRQVISGQCATVSSNIIEFRVDTPVNGGVIAANQTICAAPGDPANLSSTSPATGGAFTGVYNYQWEESTVGAGGPYNTIGGATSTTYNPPPGVITTTYYRRRVTSGVCAGFNIAYSNVITVTVDQVVVPGAVNNPQTICSGQDPAILGETTPPSGGNGSTYTFQWQESATGGGAGFAAAPGINSNATYDPPVLTATRFYRRRVTSGVCPPTFSNEIQITVNPLPTAPNPAGGGAVCAGNPAPDIVWTGLTGAAPFTITYTIGGVPQAPVVEPTTTFTIVGPLVAGNYQISVLQDANGCFGTSLGGFSTVTIGGFPPNLDAPFSLNTTSACDDGGATLDPVLNFSLDFNSASLNNFTLRYTIDGSAVRIKNFNTDAAGDPIGLDAPITFTDAELNTVLPSPHVITIVSIISQAGCQTIFNTPLNFTVQPRPPTATNPINGVACIGGGGSPISVDDPQLVTPNTEIRWSTGGPALASFANADPGSGTAGGTNFNTFTPTNSATATFYAFVVNTSTGCFSTTGIAVQHTEDLQPAMAVAGPDQPGLCAGTATMASTAATNGGSGTWTVLGQLAYQQNFENNTVFPIGTTTSAAANGWTIDTSAPNAFPQNPAGGYFEVRAGKRFEAENTNGSLGIGAGNVGEVAWFSEVIDISSLTSVFASVDMFDENNNLENEDYYNVFYRLNGGVEMPFTTNESEINDFPDQTASVTGLTGATLQIVIRIATNGGGEIIAFDNVIVKEVGSMVSFNDPNATNAVVSNLPQNPPGGAPIPYTARWTVASGLGACPSSFADVILTVNPLPTSVDPAPNLCEDVAGGGSTANVDLTSYDAAVTNAPTVAWYSNPLRTPPFLITTPVTVNNAGSKIFYFTATGAGPGFCTNIGQITFTVDPLPASANQVVQICEDNPPGSLVASGINLQNYELVAAGGSMVNRDIEWYEDVTLTTLIPPGAAAGAEQNYSFNADKTIHAKIIDTSSPVVPPCFSQATLDLDYQARPNDNQITDGIGQVLGATYTVCASSNLVLLQINPGLNAGSTYTWTVPPVSYAGEFELLTGTNDFFIILRLQNSIPAQTWNAGTTYALGDVVTDGVRRYQSLIAGNIGNMPAPGGTPQWSDISPATLYPTGLPISVKETLGTALCDGNTINTRIIVEGSPPKPIIAGPTSVCSGANGLVYSVTNPVAGSYSWTLPAGATITSLPVTASSITVQMSTFSGNVNVTHASGTGCTSPAADPLGVTVVARPTITSPSSLTICSGTDLSVAHTLTSSIAGTTYDWDVINTTGFLTGTFLGDAATGVLSINRTLNNTSGVTASVIFRVIPIGPGPDNCAGNPQNFTVTIDPEPVIVGGQNKSVCSGSPANYKILLNPGALPALTKFQWPVPFMPAGLSGGTANPTAGGEAQANAIHIADVLVNATSGPLSAVYTVTPMNGTCPGTPVDVTIVVNPKPSIPLQSATICSGGTFSITPVDGVPSAATIVPAGTTYTWTAPTVNPTAGSLTGASAQGTGQPSISQTLTNTTNVVQTATYTVTPTSGAAGACVGSTFQVTVQVDPSPQIPAQSTSICSGGTFTVTPANGVPTAATVVPAATTYTWLAPTVSPTPGSLTGTSAQGTGQLSISQTLTNTTNIAQTATYTVTPTSGASGSCVGPTFQVIVQVDPKPEIPALSSTICSGGTFTVTPVNGSPTAATIVPAGTTYTWALPTVAPNPGSLTGVSAQGAPQASISQTLTNTTNIVQTATYTVTPTSGASGACVGATFQISVQVDPKPEIPAQSTTICSGDTFIVAPANGNPTAATILPAGTTYTWTAPTVSPTPGSLSGASAQGSAQPNISQMLTNTTNVVQTATYTVTPTSGASGSCLGASFQVIVQVDPKPEIPTQSATICSGGTFTVTPTNGNPTAATIVPASTTYTWAAPTVLPTAGSLTGAAAQPVGQPSISQTLTNTTNVVQTATYTVIPTSGASGACVGSAFQVTVQVDPKPEIPAQSATICSGATFTITPVNGNPSAATIVPAGTTYTWTAPTVSPTPGSLTGVGAQGAGQPNISQTLTNTTNVVQTATYTVTPTSGASGSCVGSTFQVAIQVDPKPEIPAQSATICSGGTFTITPTNGNPTAATIVPTATTYTWTAPSISPTPGSLTGAVAQGTGQPNISQTLTNTTNIVQTATYTVTPTSGASGSCVGSTFQVTVQVDPKPEIPAQSATICSGATFSVTPANGNPTAATIVPGGTTYTWTAPTVSPTPGSLTGASAQGTGQFTISQTLTNTTNVVQTATYTVTPTSGAVGSCVGSNFQVVVTVNPKPEIPAQSQTICSGDIFTISPSNGNPTAATIVPGGTTYTWTAPTVSPTIGSLTGAAAEPVPQANISQMLTNTTNIPQTATYTVTPTSGAAGSCVGSTFTVAVTVNPKPEIPDQTATICSGNTFAISPANGVPNAATIVPASTTYSWGPPTIAPTAGSLTGAGGQVGQPSVSQTLTNTTNVVQTATYTVTPTSGAAGACPGASFMVTVTVNPKPEIPPQTATICSGDIFTITPTDGNPTAATIVPAGTTYTWTAPTITPTAGSLTGASAQGAPQPNISQMLTNTTNISQTATYTVTPTSGAAGSCVGSTFTVAVTVNPKPEIPAQSTTICSGDIFNVSPTNGNPTLATIVPAGTTYSWGVPTINPTAGSLTGASADAGQPSISQMLTNTTNVVQTATYTVTPTSGAAGACPGSPFTVTVTVNPKPEIPAQSTTICGGGTFVVTPANGNPTAATIVPAGTTYTWTAPVVTGGIIGGSAQGTGQANISQTLINPTNTVQTATYTVTPTSGAAGSCVGSTFQVTVTVNPTPIIPNQTPTICSGTAFNVSPVNAAPTTVVPAGTTYTWLAPVVTGGITGGNAQPVGQPNISETLANPTNVPQTATYTVTPTSGAAGSCVGADFQVVVTVNPTPVIPAQAATVCSDATFNVSPVNGGATIVPAGTTYSWGAPIITGGMTGASAQAGQASISQTLTNLSGSPQTATYQVTPTSGAAGSCIGAQFNVVITVNPEPVAQALSTIERCSGDPIAFDIQDIIDNVPPFAGGNSVVSKFSYTVVADFPLEVSPAVFPGVFDRVVATNAPISETFSNLSYRDVTLTYSITPISDPENCMGTPFTLEVIIHPEPVGSNVVDPVCSTTLNHNIQSQITNPVPGLPSVFTYTFTPDPGNPTVVPLAPAVPPYDRTVASNANITDQYSNTTGSPATVTYTITPYNAANPTCAGTPFTYQVVISPNPTGVSDTKVAKCSDVAFVEDPQNNIFPAVASTFTWTATYDFGITGGLSSGTGVIAENLHNETAGQLFARYTVIPSAGSCTGAAFFIDIPIDAEPVILPALSAPPAVCSSNAISTVPIGVILDTNGISVDADSYTITAVSVDPMLTPIVGPAATGTPFPANSPAPGESDAIALDAYRNTTSAQLNVVYTVRPTSADGCQGDPFNITVTINPEPVLATPVWPDVCSSNTGVSNPVNVVLGTNGTSAAASSYQLIDRTYSDGGPFSTTLPTGFTAPGVVAVGSSGSINLVKNDKYTNVSTVPVTVRYSIQATSSQGCLSELLDYDVVINPEPILQIPVPAPVCSDVMTNITLVEQPGSAVASTFNINNIIRQPGLVAGGSNASIGLGQPNNAIFNDTFTNTTAGDLTVTYKIAPVTALGCVGAQRDLVLTIQPAPAVAALSKTVCTNEPSGITLSAEVTSAPVAVPFGFNILGVTIQAGLNQTAGNTGIRMGVTASEIVNDQFENLPPSTVPLTVTYSIQGITSAGCTGPAKDIVLTVEPTILAVPVNNSANICSATPTDIDLTSPTMPTSGTITFNYTAVSSVGGQMTGFVPAISNLPLNYKITDNLVNNSDNVATLTYNITPVANGAKSGAGCIGAAVPVVVNVEPKPKLVASPLVQTVCESDGVNVSPTNILLTSTTVPSAGTLEFNQISAMVTGGLTLISPLKTTYLNGESITDQWDNPTQSDQTVTYTLRPVVNGGLGCSGDDVIVTVTIKPRPIITPVAPQAVCSGEFRSISLVTDIPGTFATWTVAAPGTITGALNGGGNSLDITLFNSGFNVETVTYTVTPKFNNCNGTPTDIVITVNPTPNTTGLPPTITVCDGATLNVPLTSSVPGTTWDWVVTDVFNLEVPGFFDGNGTTINQVVNNPNGFQAVLIYQVTPTTPAGCVGLPKIMNVNVGSIVANVTPDQTSICSGRRIQMTNSSLGATSHRWFYRVQGTTTEIDVRTTPFVNYQLDNTTATNPLVYEIVYQPSNGLCTIPDVVTPITVYRNVVAGFNEGTIPPIVGGTSTVNFSNTSNPNDGSQFRYEWDFGSTTFANPPTFVGATPPPIVYSQQGPYQVTVKAINIAAETAGLMCESSFFKTIVIPVLPLVADFTLDPPAGCFPTTVRVSENLSTGDVMEWQVVDSNGKVVAVSGQDLPEFFIPTPGLFNVQLTTRDSFTDQVEFANANFEIYDVPIASFQARPTTVFIPDTELTTFNFSTGADFYQWDFGDGVTSDEREPKHIYKIEGVYDIVMVAGFDHGNGVLCTDTLTQKVTAKQGGQTKVPNAFTPNPAGPSGGVTGGQGAAGSFNDVFLPIVKGVEEFNMQIFDRWGNLIFESNSANQGWDGYDRNGNILPSGVYVYKLTLRLSDGQRTTQIGDITMIR